mmetsp:Transcript_145495/g.464964  ORF Transcript_145495/g.464964 Transcript_145495/m.464964 type:complete len:233 (-) Transcript_145495:722-1420(-)
MLHEVGFLTPAVAEQVRHHTVPRDPRVMPLHPAALHYPVAGAGACCRRIGHRGQRLGAGGSAGGSGGGGSSLKVRAYAGKFAEALGTEGDCPNRVDPLTEGHLAIASKDNCPSPLLSSMLRLLRRRCGCIPPCRRRSCLPQGLRMFGCFSSTARQRHRITLARPQQAPFSRAQRSVRHDEAAGRHQQGRGRKKCRRGNRAAHRRRRLHNVSCQQRHLWNDRCSRDQTQVLAT